MAKYAEHGALYSTDGSFVAYLADDTWEDEHDADDVGDEQAHTAIASGLGAYTDSDSKCDDWMDALPCLESDSDSEASASVDVMLDYSSSGSDAPPPLVYVDSLEGAYSSTDDEPPPLTDVDSSCDAPPDLLELSASQWTAIHDKADFKKLDLLAKQRKATLQADLVADGCANIAELWDCNSRAEAFRLHGERDDRADKLAGTGR